MKGQLGRSPTPRLPIHADAVRQFLAEERHPPQHGLSLTNRAAKAIFTRRRRQQGSQRSGEGEPLQTCHPRFGSKLLENTAGKKMWRERVGGMLCGRTRPRRSALVPDSEKHY